MHCINGQPRKLNATEIIRTPLKISIEKTEGANPPCPPQTGGFFTVEGDSRGPRRFCDRWLYHIVKDIINYFITLKIY